MDGIVSLLVGLVLGSVLGVIADRTIGKAIDKRLIEPLLQRRSLQTAQKLATTFSRVHNELVIFANGGVFVHQFASVGFSWTNITARLKPDTSSVQALLPESHLSTFSEVTVEEIEAQIKKSEENISQNPRFWDGTLLALTHMDISREGREEMPVLSMQFEARQYSRSRAVQELWMSLPFEERRSLSGDQLREVDSLLCNAFGVNCTVSTADGKLLVARRGANTIGQQGFWHTSMNEGVAIIDSRPGGIVNLSEAYWRGLHEELGITREMAKNSEVVVHSVILDVDRYEWALLGHLDLGPSGITSTQIIQMRNLGMAPDGWEASDIRFIDFTHKDISSVERELENHSQWIPHGLVNLALTAIYCFPLKAQQIYQTFSTAKKT